MNAPAGGLDVIARGIGQAVAAACAEQDRIRAARTPAEVAADLEKMDREMWIRMVRHSPCDWPARVEQCMRCGEVRPHTRHCGLCQVCMRVIRRKIREGVPYEGAPDGAP